MGKGRLFLHLRTHLREERFTCTSCGRAYSHKKNLMHHMKEKHVDMYTTHMEVYSNKSILRNNNGKFSCTECGKEFARKWGLIRHHERKHLRTGVEMYKTEPTPKHNTGVGICDTQPADVGMSEKENILENSGRIFSCTECDKRYAHKTSLSQHMKVKHIQTHRKALSSIDNTAVGVYNTQPADVGMSEKENVLENNGRIFSCTECDKRYAHKTSLSHHMKVKHVQTHGKAVTSIDKYIIENLPQEDKAVVGIYNAEPALKDNTDVGMDV